MPPTARPAYKYQEYFASAITGKPLEGIYVKVYNAGTTTPATKYTDSTATVEDGSTIITDSVGFFSCYLPPNDYDVRFFTTEADYLSNTNAITELTDILIDGFTGTSTAEYISFSPEEGISSATVQDAIIEAKNDAIASIGDFQTQLTSIQTQLDTFEDYLENINHTEYTITATSNGQTVFVLPGSATYDTSVDVVEVYINGSRQPNTTFTKTNTTTITLDEGVANNTEVIIKVLTTVLGNADIGLDYGVIPAGTQIKHRRGTTAEHSTFTGAAGEVTVDTTKDVVVVHDGSTAGGFALVSETGTQTLTNKTLISPIFNGGAALTATSTELNYVKDVTSNIQTQLNAKQNASTAITISNIASQTVAACTGNAATATYATTAGYADNGVALQSQTFNSSGTWTKPTDGTFALVECWGGGGGGCQASGGGGGGYCARLVQLASLPATVTVTIGAGGAGDDLNGVTGGTTSFGSYAAATGGTGGIYLGNNAYAGGIGGYPSTLVGVLTGNLLGAGIGGTGGGSYDDTHTAATPATSGGGGGGASGSAGGGSSHGGAGGNYGVAGTAPGGGGGAYSSAGKAGAAGRCIVTVF